MVLAGHRAGSLVTVTRYLGTHYPVVGRVQGDTAALQHPCTQFKIPRWRWFWGKPPAGNNSGVQCEYPPIHLPHSILSHAEVTPSSGQVCCLLVSGIHEPGETHKTWSQPQHVSLHGPGYHHTFYCICISHLQCIYTQHLQYLHTTTTSAVYLLNVHTTSAVHIHTVSTHHICNIISTVSTVLLCSISIYCIYTPHLQHNIHCIHCPSLQCIYTPDLIDAASQQQTTSCVRG